jgi:beta-1,4-mannosyltransferase
MLLEGEPAPASSAMAVSSTGHVDLDAARVVADPSDEIVVKRTRAPRVEPLAVPSARVDPRELRLARHRRSPTPHFVGLLCLIAAVTALFWTIAAPRTTALNYFLSVVWSMYFPLAIVGSIGAVHHRVRHRKGGSPTPSRAARRSRASKMRHPSSFRGAAVPRSFFTGQTDKVLIVVLPSMVCAANLPALKRVIGSLLRFLPAHFASFRVDVIAEDGADVAPLMRWLDDIGALGTRVRVHVVPTSYSTPNGARFKTRANHYAMEARRVFDENTAGTYVYHLDDDTSIAADTAASLAEFIESGRGHLLAQGVLAFPRELTPSRLCWLADAIRPADDLTRFAFFTGFLGTPLGGLHGEHVVVRADVEDEIGWDFPDTVIEDAYFALEFAKRYPRRATTLNSYSYGASPSSVHDLIRQRRRWIEGLLRLIKNPRLPLRSKLPLTYSVLTWALAPLQFIGLALVISYATGIDNTSPVNIWLIPIWSTSLAWVFWLYFEGLKVNLAASDRSDGFVRYAIVLIPFIYIVSAVETCGIILGIMRFFGIGPQHKSEVITKPM